MLRSISFCLVSRRVWGENETNSNTGLSIKVDSPIYTAVRGNPITLPTYFRSSGIKQRCESDISETWSMVLLMAHCHFNDMSEHKIGKMCDHKWTKLDASGNKCAKTDYVAGGVRNPRSSSLLCGNVTVKQVFYLILLCYTNYCYGKLPLN
ncbi:hypothetical protein AVEN_132578-1 [Araneus ventricosus]|uniref:Uncharacterized protein n=1 Tax=Araneus ventricosus TaxID=182803 RepID=A0A4Y2T413_ARAVE|nr:hypothetical protein AVEN_132578-1 [Araneus ventricosus]